MLVVGPILDRVNLRWAFAIAVVLWSAVSGFTGLVNGFVALLLCRLALPWLTPSGLGLGREALPGMHWFARLQPERQPSKRLVHNRVIR